MISTLRWMRSCCSRTCSSLNLYLGLSSMFVVVCTTASGVREVVRHLREHVSQVF